VNNKNHNTTGITYKMSQLYDLTLVIEIKSSQAKLF